MEGMFYNVFLSQKPVIFCITAWGAIIYTSELCGCYTIAASKGREIMCCCLVVSCFSLVSREEHEMLHDILLPGGWECYINYAFIIAGGRLFQNILLQVHNIPAKS